MALDNVLFELRHSEPHLKHVEADDRSGPKIEPGTTVHHFDKAKFIQEIEGGAPLKHPDEVSDRSAPQLSGIQMQPNPRPALLAEVKAIGGHTAVVSEVRALASEAGGSGVALKHVEAPADRSAPMTDGASVGQWDKKAFLGEISSPGKALKHVDQVNDRSHPHVEPDVKIKRHPHDELMSEVRSSSPQQLRHVEATSDRSSPHVTHTAALRMQGSGGH
ncbi:hypothetical protein HYH02_003929 [Chlamydomonas schloesseri]|uniref:Uncharacterized protein n=1 Tax=Chlamydomonas schloesseri TaxID=2026947 RepID=A0A835WQ28_9CHLO|nr:hypothetical protein HYH02_003929 [Chlamydomonas schloesseri]|eukprot:KAG2451324.1 hypothetical protein HYH02_003929 [Chlamydomonas schloesseri]